MTRTWRSLLTFVGGLLVGAVGAWCLVNWHWQRNFSNWYVVQVADQANVAREILSGRGVELAERIKSDLPAYVEAMRSEFGDAEGAEWALWMVSDVYQVAGATPPAELKAVLAALPPRASCRPPA